MRPAIRESSVLVTGGAGFIGSHLVDRLLALGARQVVVIDNMFLGREENLAGAHEAGAILYKDDAADELSLEQVVERHSIDIVFNAATKALNYSFVDPADAFRTNVDVVLNLLQLQRRKAFSTLCHFSSSEVYGTAAYEPMDERHPIHPTTTYAAGKAAADLAIESYVRMFDLDAFIVRPFNNYGPRQNYEGYLAGVIPITIWRILNGLPPEIHGTGRQTRDFIYVLDTVRAIVDLYPKARPGEGVNVASDDQIAIADVIQKIVDIVGYRGEMLRREGRKADVECHHASNARLRSMIDYRPTPFESGLTETIAWYRSRLEAASNRP